MSLDRLSNMVSSIKNISMSGRDSLEIPFTFECESIATVLKEKGLADLIMINGLYRHGFMISPAVMDCALEVLEQGQSNTALDLGLSITGNISTHESSLCA